MAHPRDPVRTWFFALVVARWDDRFLVVQERKHGQVWYLPAGRVEPGESLLQGAFRETMEEAGIPIELEGIVRIEHTVYEGAQARLRVFFVARPKDDTPPKQVPDEHSLQARWVTLEELNQLPLRDAEVRELFELVAGGAPVAPMSLLQTLWAA